VKRLMVRYTVKPERAAENVELVRAVYDELHGAQPAGLRYATFQLGDGVSFVHLVETEDEHDPLPDVPAFQRFQEGIRERCDDAPVVSELHEIGSYRLPRRLRHGCAQPPGSETRRETQLARGEAATHDSNGRGDVLAQPTGDGYWPLVTIAETTSPSASPTKRRQSCEK
jgi:hypothetical protein